MPLGGGGVDDQYTAQFTVKVDGLQNLERLDGVLRRMSQGAQRANVGAIGQSIREASRLASGLDQIARSMSKSQKGQADSLRATARGIKAYTTELNDLRRQYKAGAAELSAFADKLEQVAAAVPTNVARSGQIKQAISDQAAVIRQRAQELSRIEQVELERRAKELAQIEEEAFRRNEAKRQRSEQQSIKRRARAAARLERAGLGTPGAEPTPLLEAQADVAETAARRVRTKRRFRRLDDEARRSAYRDVEADQAARVDYAERKRFYENWINKNFEAEQRALNEARKAAAARVQANEKARQSALQRTQEFMFGKQDTRTALQRAAEQSARYQTQLAQEPEPKFKSRAEAEAFYEKMINDAYKREQKALAAINEQQKQAVSGANARASAEQKVAEGLERSRQAAARVQEALEKGRKGGLTRIHTRDRERGQMMPVRPREQAKALLDLSSAAQGVMLGMSAVQGNIMGVAFSLIFLSYGIVKIVALFAALTAAVMALKKALLDLPLAAAKVAREFEATGQQMASFLRSAEASMKIMAQANALAARFGMEVDDLRKGLFELTKVQQNNDAVVAAFLNAAAATGRSFGEIAAQYSEILRASADQRSRLVQQFAKDMDITVRDYANTAELIDAINKRFTGSADAYAQTTKGMIGRIRGYWNEFMTLVGSVANEIIKPLLELFMSFVQGLVRGFSAALDRGKETGELTKRITDLREAAKQLAPYLERIGYFLGRALYYALILGMQALKKFIDTLRWAIQLIKDFVDTLRGKNNELKESLINYPPLITGIVTVIARAFISLFRTLVDDFAKKLPSVFDDVAKATKSLADDIMKPFRAIGDDIAKIFAPVRRKFAAIADDLLKPFKPLGKAFTTLFDDIFRVFNTFADDVARAFSGKNFFSGLRTAWDDAARGLGTAFRTFADDVGRVFKTLWDDAIRGVGRFATSFVDELTRLPQTARTVADDILKALTAPFSRSFWDDIFRGIGGGGAKMGSVFDDIFKGIGGVGKGAFKGILSADDIIRSVASNIDEAAKGLMSGAKNMWGGLISALKSGLIIALVEAVTLKGIDMLPISDKLKTSLSGIAQTTALGAGLGTAFGPVGILVGAALGAAVGTGLELIAPGTADKVMTWINDTIGKAVVEGFAFLKENVLPNVRDFLEGLFGEGGDSTAANLGEGLRNAIETTKEVIAGFFDFIGPKAKATWDFVREESAALADWIKTNFGPTFADMKRWFEEEFWPSMQSVWGWIKENIVPILAGIASFIVDTLGPALLKLVAWLAEHLWPIIKEVADAVGTRLAKEFKALWELFENYVWPVIKTVVDKLGDLFEAASNVAKKISEELEPYFRSLWDFIDKYIKPVIEWLVGTLGLGGLKLAIEAFKHIPGPFETIKTALDNIKNVAEEIWEFLQKIGDWDPKDAIEAGVRAVVPKPFEGAALAITDKLGATNSKDKDKKPTGPSGGELIASSGRGLAYSSGGIVPGVGYTDKVPAMLTPGELILNAAQQRNLAEVLRRGSSGYNTAPIVINVQVSDSVVTNDLAMNQLAGAVADKIVGRMGLGRQFTFHRV